MIDISKWAFKNRNLVYFLIAVLLVGGGISCYQMSKLEDPEIKVKLAMVATVYPGASAHQVELEVTDPLEKARRRCAPYGDAVQCRLGNGLSVVHPGEAEDIIIAGMGAETVIEILEAAPWVFDARYNLVLVPATKHSVLRRWLARRGFALLGETLCQAAGRWYAVMNARYAGTEHEPDGLECLCGKTEGQPGFPAYCTQQNIKLKKYRLGLAPGAEADAVDALIEELEKRACL